MREIKFRAWDVEQNKYIYDSCEYEMRILGFKGSSPCNKCNPKCKENNSPIGFMPCPYLVMEEYTGLKDKNGVEIWEGDWLKDSHGKSIVEYCISEYTGSKFCQHYKGNKVTGPSSNGTWEMFFFTNSSLCEVIGNIHTGDKDEHSS